MNPTGEQDLRIVLTGVEWDVVDLIDSLPGHLVAGFLAPAADGQSEAFRHLGHDDDWPALLARDGALRLALAMDAPHLRARLYNDLGRDAFVSLVSPHAHVSRRSSVGDALVLQRACIVMPNCSIGAGCKINVGAVLHHDVTVSDFCTVAPRATLLGRVVVEDRVFIGAGAVIRPRCRIGAGATVGAGAVVVRDVPAGSTVMGVPARDKAVSRQA